MCRSRNSVESLSSLEYFLASYEIDTRTELTDVLRVANLDAAKTVHLLCLVVAGYLEDACGGRWQYLIRLVAIVGEIGVGGDVLDICRLMLVTTCIEDDTNLADLVECLIIIDGVVDGHALCEQ